MSYQGSVSFRGIIIEYVSFVCFLLFIKIEIEFVKLIEFKIQS